MSRIARAVVLACLVSAILGASGCAAPRAHPWQPPGCRPPIHTWTGTYAEYPPSIEKPPGPDTIQGNPSDG
jgi:hypothetical protein